MGHCAVMWKQRAAAETRVLAGRESARRTIKTVDTEVVLILKKSLAAAHGPLGLHSARW